MSKILWIKNKIKFPYLNKNKTKNLILVNILTYIAEIFSLSKINISAMFSTILQKCTILRILTYKYQMVPLLPHSFPMLQVVNVYMYQHLLQMFHYLLERFWRWLQGRDHLSARWIQSLLNVSKDFLFAFVVVVTILVVQYHQFNVLYRFYKVNFNVKDIENISEVLTHKFMEGFTVIGQLKKTETWLGKQRLKSWA